MVIVLIFVKAVTARGVLDLSVFAHLFFVFCCFSSLFIVVDHDHNKTHDKQYDDLMIEYDDMMML